MTEKETPVELIAARPVPRPGRWVAAAIVGVLVAMAIHALITNPNFQWPLVWKWLFSKTIMTGVLYTLILTVLAMVLGTILALTMAVMRQSPNPVLRYVATFYIWFFRGTPIYTQLIFNTASVLTVFWMAVLGLGFNEGAYLSEIIRAGINSVDKGQWEAATALGMSRGQIMRRIVLPQAMRVIVPPLGNETISMLKTTSLVAAIPFTLELTFAASTKGHQLFAPIPLLIDAAIWYLVITSVLMVAQHYIEAYYGKGFDGATKKKKKDKGAAKATDDALEQQDPEGDEPTFLEVTP